MDASLTDCNIGERMEWQSSYIVELDPFVKDTLMTQ
jgi:hypothetical protein